MATPLFFSSGDLIADRRYQLARELEKRGELAGAADLYGQAVEIAPGFASAWFALGEVRLRLGDAALAAAAFGKAIAADPEDRHGAAVQLVRLTGKPAAMPPGYLRALFDQYAPHYDLSLIEGLNYRGPQLLFDAVTAAGAALPRQAHFHRALDLGCGTGLAGALFAPHIDSLTGVDLSAAMIEQARRGGCYDQLHVGDALAFLSGEIDRSVDLVIAADSLPYVAELAPVFHAIGRVLKIGGSLAFTAETHEGEGVLLGETLRYAHGAAHVLGALADAGLTPVHLQETSYRSEKGIPVPGLVVVAAKLASTAPPSTATSSA
jgi:predicted TPR repeat methyltransferase